MAAGASRWIARQGGIILALLLATTVAERVGTELCCFAVVGERFFLRQSVAQRRRSKTRLDGFDRLCRGRRAVQRRIRNQEITDEKVMQLCLITRIIKPFFEVGEIPPPNRSLVDTSYIHVPQSLGNMSQQHTPLGVDEQDAGVSPHIGLICRALPSTRQMQCHPVQTQTAQLLLARIGKFVQVETVDIQHIGMPGLDVPDCLEMHVDVGRLLRPEVAEVLVAQSIARKDKRSTLIALVAPAEDSVYLNARILPPELDDGVVSRETLCHRIADLLFEVECLKLGGNLRAYPQALPFCRCPAVL